MKGASRSSFFRKKAAAAASGAVAAAAAAASNGNGKAYNRGVCHPLRLLVPVSFALCFFTALYLMYTSSEDIIWSTRTVAGDNLGSTPWHPFEKPEGSSWEKLSRTPKVLHCTYLSCALALPSFTWRAPPSPKNASACPSFFQWIHQDLAPWRRTGISPQKIEEARQFAAFRVVIVNGRLYTELYYQCVQSRAMFTLWGLLMLLDRFPGMVPDVDFMFNCMDRPHFMRKDYRNGQPPPPLFAYCGTKGSFEIPFPDWSYWGWAEVNIGPWDQVSASVFGGSDEISWKDRRPTAHWKGNPHVGAQVRTDLLACNRTDSQDYGAEVYRQDWNAEAQEGYKNSNLSKQCAHRYKIYAEGHAWSVSFKYIMACGSTLLLINPEYHDFFMRGLLPQYHYWPIDRRNLCPSIKNAVQWGNSHPKEAEGIGKQGQDFLREDLSMDHVYDYMLHLLQEYAKLQSFKPTVPQGAQLLCKNAILCIADPVQKKFLERSVPHTVDPSTPCSMPPPDQKWIRKFKEDELAGFRAVQEMENKRIVGKRLRQEQQKVENSNVKTRQRKRNLRQAKKASSRVFG